MNDCPPTLPQDNYEVSVSESAPFGSVVLKVTAHDDDGPGRVNNLFYIIFSPCRCYRRKKAFRFHFRPSECLFFRACMRISGINSEITYSIQTDNNKNSSEFFHIDENEGTVYLKKALDHETLQHHHFTIRVSDKGSPALSSSKTTANTIL